MERTTIKSSLLASVGYDSKTKTLEIEFLRQQNDHSRRIYRYEDVPYDVYVRMMGLDLSDADFAHHSVGANFLIHVRPNYKFTRVEEPREETEEESAL